ncbi:MAG: hypothetical protein JNL82_39340 [Myxococcales bacterium]|nr:hypothetical protein [Myxococcales bacterium]
MASSSWFAFLLFGAGALLGAACTGPLPGDEGTASESGGETGCPIGSLNCLCTDGNACDEGLVCASNRCVPDETATGETGSSSTGVDPTTSSDVGETTAASECDPGGGGSVDPACPSGQPYCLAGECVDCSGIECAAVSPGEPVCNQNSGLCDVCACDDANPVCDPEAHTCGKCTAHDQCSGSACDLWTGACMPVAAALWVDMAGACDDAAAGTPDAPLCTLGAAFTRVQAAPGEGHAIRVRAGAYEIDASLAIPEDGLVAVVHATGGDDDPPVTLAAVAGSRAFEVATGGALLLDGIGVTSGGSDALSCSAGKLWLDRLSVSGVTGHGIATVDCDVKLRRSVLTGNTLSGAYVSSGAIHIENSYISSNGNTGDGAGGVYLTSGAALEAVYTSFIDNLAVAGSPFSVACNEDGDPAIESVFVRNSVAINKGNSTLCDGSTIQRTGWTAKDGMPGMDNISITFPEMPMYLTPDPQLPGVYRAIEGTALDQLATWEAGDPEIDFDGDPRPSGENSPDFAGADRVSD